MSTRQLLSTGLAIVVGLLMLTLVIGSVLGQPILLSYVETGSMDPTLSTNDGFVAVPSELAGPIERGDVITFEAKTIQGGGLTTHRVVGTTDRGFITRGDANPVTDQASDEPPVRPEQIVAVAWQPGGTVLSLPALGTIVEVPQNILQAVQIRLAALFGTRRLLGAEGLGYLLFGVTMALLGLDLLLSDGDSQRHTRDRSRNSGTSARLIVAAIALTLVLGATAAMVVPAGSQEYTIISAEFESEDPTVIPQGERSSIEYPAANGGVIPVVAFLDSGSEAVSIDRRELQLGPNAVMNTSVTLSAPPETGSYRRYVTEHRYLMFLPVPVIRALHSVHPWLPIIAIDALLAIPTYLFGVRVVGTGRIRSRARKTRSMLTRLYNRYL